MSTTTPDKCPWCGEAQAPLMGAGEVRYKCGSMTHESGLLQQHPSCEASVLRKQVEELEEAGDELFLRIGCGCGSDGCKLCDKACAAWFEAKGHQ